MSGRLVSAVYESTLPAWLKPYAAVCASFAADDGSRVYPTVARVARMAGRRERATQTALTELRRRKILIVEVPAGRYRATSYRFQAAALPRASDGAQLLLFPQATSSKSGAKPEVASSFPQDAQQSTGMGAAHCTPWVQPTAPDPSGDPLRTNQRTRARAEKMPAPRKAAAC